MPLQFLYGMAETKLPVGNLACFEIFPAGTVCRIWIIAGIVVSYQALRQLSASRSAPTTDLRGYLRKRLRNLSSYSGKIFQRSRSSFKTRGSYRRKPPEGMSAKCMHGMVYIPMYVQ